MIRAPERLLPGTLEKIALRDVGTRLFRYNLEQLLHRVVDGARVSARDGQIRSLSRNSWKRRGAACGDDRQGKSVQNSGIHGGVPGRGQLFGRRSGETLVEVQ